VRHTAARRASAECQALVTPNVAVESALVNDFHRALVVIAPKAGMATADRAVAAYQRSRLARHVDHYCSAVTGTGEHELRSSAANDECTRRADERSPRDEPRAD
jgi:hypothetical protein